MKILDLQSLYIFASPLERRDTVAKHSYTATERDATICERLFPTESALYER